MSKPKRIYHFWFLLIFVCILNTASRGQMIDHQYHVFPKENMQLSENVLNLVSSYNESLLNLMNKICKHCTKAEPGCGECRVGGDVGVYTNDFHKWEEQSDIMEGDTSKVEVGPIGRIIEIQNLSYRLSTEKSDSLLQFEVISDSLGIYGLDDSFLQQNIFENMKRLRNEVSILGHIQNSVYQLLLKLNSVQLRKD